MRSGSTFKWINQTVIVLILLLLLMILLALAAYACRYTAMQKKSSYLDLQSTPQVWAHRGYQKGLPENSLEALSKALHSGAPGIELDTHFDSSMNRFVISHDTPYQKHNGKLLFLEKVFNTLENTGDYWIDLKNLSADNIDPVSRRMRTLLDKYDLDRFVFIEFWHGDELSIL